MPLPSMGGIVLIYDLTIYDLRFIFRHDVMSSLRHYEGATVVITSLRHVVITTRDSVALSPLSLFIKQIHGAVYTLQAEGCDDVLCHGDTFG